MIFSVVFLLACYVLLIIVIVRCADGRIGVNGLAGIRIPSIMATEQTWIVGHQAAKRPSLTGIYCAIICLLPTPFVPGEALQVVFLLGSCLIMLIGVIVGASAGSKAAKLVLATPY
ncbi:SdpI family protein [Arthrobacter sp. LAPM80]|uniref:SdpI family protein n=1 Tax=Arthrobacter sp. LAPM80 TaxID=3141788 RepID=UPI00398AB111